MASTKVDKYVMTISRLTVDKLGVKLYDKVSAVIAELVANSYDADATEVEIRAPMDELLATNNEGKLVDKGYVIEVNDNGIGMTPEEVNEFYLVVGKERRVDPKRGDTSRKFKRKVMGRKGVGKIAPFGVCQKIEVLTAGGDLIKQEDQNHKEHTGYVTAHFILDRAGIVTDTDSPYYPEIGNLDGSLSKKTGTWLKLHIFDRRRVPKIEDFERQLAQRFGVPSSTWKISLADSLKTPSDKTGTRTVGQFAIDTMDGTSVQFEWACNPDGTRKLPLPRAVGPDGKVLQDLVGGFQHEGKEYPLVGWVAYSKHPYKDDLMAGIRVYCRGKIAAQTSIFNLKAGFTGEYDIRSYLVGELHADWLDETDDLIRTDRQDILWSHELGQAFEKWGQVVVKKLGTLTREPTRKKSWELFKELSKIESKIEKAFPGNGQKSIRENTLEIAKTIAKTTREDELKEPEHVESVVQLSLLLGPHITLDQKLREAAETKDSPLAVITDILSTARTAELSSFGRIADDRVRVIKKVESLKDASKTLEAAFQHLIEQAPWLINPQWSPIAENQTFTTLKLEFQKYYKKRTKKDLILTDFSDPAKRADFVMSNQDSSLEIIEIKKPKYGLQDAEMDRIIKYVELMEEFLNLPGNQDFKTIFRVFHVTLVCDEIKLTGSRKMAFSSLKEKGTLEHISWTVFLTRTRKMHEAFLREAERQRKLAVKP
jgi:hypothetical protein